MRDLHPRRLQQPELAPEVLEPTTQLNQTSEFRPSLLRLQDPSDHTSHQTLRPYIRDLSCLDQFEVRRCGATARTKRHAGFGALLRAYAPCFNMP